MRYALNLAEDYRILSATEEKYAGEGQPIVDELPDGDISEYRYIDSEYVYDPLPPPPAPEPSPDEILNALLGVEE